MRGAVWLAMFVAAMFALAGIGPSAQAAVHVGQAAPALTVPELDGKAFDLTAQRGKVVIIHYWATWCAPCRKEMPVLDAFYRRYRSRGLEVIALSVDREHDRAEVNRVMSSFAFPAAMSDDASVEDFGKPSAVPVTLVIDRNGIVRASLTPDESPLTEKLLTEVVVPLLTGEATSRPPPIRADH
ncbi:MAG: TlpA disulfide reductase family protein [Candidatus Binataceae bacterium]|jgi:peroxiredoxin